MSSVIEDERIGCVREDENSRIIVVILVPRLQRHAWNANTMDEVANVFF